MAGVLSLRAAATRGGSAEAARINASAITRSLYRRRPRHLAVAARGRVAQAGEDAPRAPAMLPAGLGGIAGSGAARRRQRQAYQRKQARHQPRRERMENAKH